jgi:hypothetical protein
MAIEKWNSNQYVWSDFVIKDDFEPSLKPESLIALAAYIGISTESFGGANVPLEDFCNLSVLVCEEMIVATWSPTMENNEQFCYREDNPSVSEEIQKENGEQVENLLLEKPKSKENKRKIRVFTEWEHKPIPVVHLKSKVYHVDPMAAGLNYFWNIIIDKVSPISMDELGQDAVIISGHPVEAQHITPTAYDPESLKKWSKTQLGESKLKRMDEQFSAEKNIVDECYKMYVMAAQFPQFNAMNFNLKEELKTLLDQFHPSEIEKDSLLKEVASTIGHHTKTTWACPITQAELKGDVEIQPVKDFMKPFALAGYAFFINRYIDFNSPEAKNDKNFQRFKTLMEKMFPEISKLSKNDLIKYLQKNLDLIEFFYGRIGPENLSADSKKLIGSFQPWQIDMMASFFPGNPYFFMRLPQWWINTDIFSKDKNLFQKAVDVLIRIPAIPIVFLSIIFLLFEALFRVFNLSSTSLEVLKQSNVELISPDIDVEESDKTQGFIVRPGPTITPQADNQKEYKEYREYQKSFEFEYIRGNENQLSLAVKDSKIENLFGFHTLCENTAQFGWIPCEEQPRNDSADLFLLKEGVQIWKRPDGDFGHFVSAKKIRNEDHDEIYIVDLRPSNADQKDLILRRNDYMERLCQEYDAKRWKPVSSDDGCHDYQIIDAKDRVVVTVHIAQSMIMLEKYKRKLSSGLVTQPAANELCGAIAAINSVRLSCDTENEADFQLNNFSEQVFSVLETEKVDEILRKRYEELCENAQAVINAQTGRNEEYKSKIPLDLKGESWWRYLSKEDQHMFAMYTYLSGCVAPKKRNRLQLV